MSRQLYFFLFVAVAVQVAYSLDERNVKKILKDENRCTRNLIRDAENKPDMASCADLYDFVPLSKAAVEKSQQCNQALKSISGLFGQIKERQMFMTALTEATEKPHSPFKYLELITKTDKYLRAVFREIRKSPEARKEEADYIKDCAMPVLEEMAKNSAAAKDKVEECLGNKKN